MVVRGCLNWSQSSILHSSPQTLASTISTPLPKRGSFNDLTLICHRAPMFGNNLSRSRSCESLNLSRPKRPIRRIVSANFDSYLSDDERASSSKLKNSDQLSANFNGGGGKSRPLVSGTDGDGKFDESIEHQTIVPSRIGEESISGQDEEWGLWKLMLAEVDEMRGVMGDGSLDHETMGQFVSPVTVKMEEVDTEDYLKTELVYQRALLTEPDNPLLLANYAQFLYLFAHDHKRAEVYFKKASEIEPKDAETLSKYASFLWHAKNDLWAAEETFLEAISADPTNSFYTASYAHFLWSNGADDTCFPLESPENVNSDEF